MAKANIEQFIRDNTDTNCCNLSMDNSVVEVKSGVAIEIEFAFAREFLDVPLGEATILIPTIEVVIEELQLVHITVTTTIVVVVENKCKTAAFVDLVGLAVELGMSISVAKAAHILFDKLDKITAAEEMVEELVALGFTEKRKDCYHIRQVELNKLVKRLNFRQFDYQSSPHCLVCVLILQIRLRLTKL